MSFYVGQQVVCINDVFPDDDPYWSRVAGTLPKLNSIYTIREIRDCDGPLAFCFYEFVNPRAQFERGYFEPSFFSWRFRAVKKTNIEAFERLLAPIDPASAKERTLKAGMLA